MKYALPVLILLMLAFMFWSSTYRMRRDRLRAIRNSDRSDVIFTRKQRVRAQLKRAFHLPDRKPQWEEDLLADLAARNAAKEKSEA